MWKRHTSKMLNGHLSKAIKYQKRRISFTLSDLLSNLNKPYSKWRKKIYIPLSIDYKKYLRINTDSLELTNFL